MSACALTPASCRAVVAEARSACVTSREPAQVEVIGARGRRLPNRATNYSYQLQLVPSSSNWQLVRGLSKQLTSYHFTGLNS